MHDLIDAPAEQLLEAPVSQCARRAGLRYLDTEDPGPGIRRRRHGKTFTYVDARGRPVRSHATLARIRALAIPPAWTGVWISPEPRSHLQATGRDARGRKQYRYHPTFRATREAVKFAGLGRLAPAIPRLRRCVSRSLARPRDEHERVLAAMARILDLTGIRVGSEEYARSNGSHGLTTLGPQHATIDGDRVTLHFRGKSRQDQTLTFTDARVAAVLAHSRGLVRGRLFAWRDADGRAHRIQASDVNDYLQRAAGQHVTAKQIRTWLASVRAAEELLTAEKLRPAICAVAAMMGHTPAVCRKSYIHPGILLAHADGSLATAFACATPSNQRSR
ncbi:MAG: DNA topoisomerase IB, partial [Myxococcales bacterium]